MKVLGEAAKSLNTYTARAVEAGFAGTVCQHVKAGFFVQLDHNISRVLSSKNWSTLYSTGSAMSMDRIWQNQSIGLGLFNIVGGVSLGVYNFTNSTSSPILPYDPTLMNDNLKK